MRHMWLNSPVSNLWTKKTQLRQKIGRMTIYWENNSWFRPTIHTGKQAWDTRKKLAICISSICSRNLWFARCDILFTGLSTLQSCPWSWGNCRHRPRHTKPPPTHWLECPKRQAFASQVPKVPKGHGWTLNQLERVGNGTKNSCLQDIWSLTESCKILTRTTEYLQYLQKLMSKQQDPSEMICGYWWVLQ